MITVLILGAKSGIRWALAISIASLLLVACGQGQTADSDDSIDIVATTSIWGDVVTEIVGDEANVEVLIPRGSDAHSFEPTAREISNLEQSDLVVANGLGLEEGLEDLLRSVPSDGVEVLELAPELDPITFADGEDLDPHVWFDPERVAMASTLIAERLSEIEPTVDWSARARDYSESLLELDEDIRAELDTVPEENRKLVTNHDSLGYFADRYGFEVVGVVVPGGSTLAEPSSAELAELVSVIEREGVPAIFAETTHPSRLAEAVAAEAGGDVAVVELHTGSLGDPGSDSGTLAGMLLTNAQLIAGALG